MIVPNACAVCTKPLRVKHERDSAVCSSCGAAYRAGRMSALAEVRAALSSTYYEGMSDAEALVVMKRAVGRVLALKERKP